MTWWRVGGKGCAAEHWRNRWWPGRRVHSHLLYLCPGSIVWSRLSSQGHISFRPLTVFSVSMVQHVDAKITVKSKGSWVGGCICLSPICSSEAMAGLWKAGWTPAAETLGVLGVHMSEGRALLCWGLPFWRSLSLWFTFTVWHGAKNCVE